MRRQSAGFVNRGLNRAADVDPEARGSTGRPVGDGSRVSMPGAGRGSSGCGAGESSISASACSAPCSVGMSGDSGVAGSPATILVIRMRGGASDGVREPGKLGVVPAFGLVAADGAIPREKTNAWIAMEAAMEATSTRRPSLRRAAACAVSHVREARVTLARSGFRGVTACRSSSRTMFARSHNRTGCLALAARHRLAAGAVGTM